MSPFTALTMLAWWTPHPTAWQVSPSLVGVAFGRHSSPALDCTVPGAAVTLPSPDPIGSRAAVATVSTSRRCIDPFRYSLSRSASVSAVDTSPFWTSESSTATALRLASVAVAVGVRPGTVQKALACAVRPSALRPERRTATLQASDGGLRAIAVDALARAATLKEIDVVAELARDSLEPQPKYSTSCEVKVTADASRLATASVVRRPPVPVAV